MHKIKNDIKVNLNGKEFDVLSWEKIKKYKIYYLSDNKQCIQSDLHWSRARRSSSRS